MKALFIDEDLEIERLVNVLQARHPEDNIELADTLADARGKLWSTKYDVLVIDSWMPPDDDAVPKSSDEAGLISGLLLLDVVRSDPDCLNCNAPAFLFTGLVPGEHPRVKGYQEEHAQLFLQKPLHPDAIYSTLARAVRKPNQ